MVLAEVREGNYPYATYGELVHNPQVLRALEDRGVSVCDAPERLAGGTLFLRTHGTTLEKRRELEALPLKVRDLTCPRVATALELAAAKSAEGYDVIVLGDPDHQEVECLRSYGGPGARVISGPDEADSLGDVSRPFLLSQTTQNTRVFKETVKALKERFPALEHRCTICNSTGLRQEELRKLCCRADCVVVVGGRNSANTARLAEIAREEGHPCLHVETHEEIEEEDLAGYDDILLTAGASTPSWSIRKVRERLLEIQGGGFSKGEARKFLSNVVFSNSHLLPVTFMLGASGACVLRTDGWVWHVAAASLFLFAVHVMTSVLESARSRPSGLRRQGFIRRRRKVLAALSVAACAASIALSLLVRPLLTLLLVLMLAAFTFYSLPLVRSFRRFRGLRALPGSRDFIFAGAWSFLLAFVPSYLSRGTVSFRGAVLWAGILFLLFLGRSLLADLVDLQGDALMGMDTIPIHAGRRRSVVLFWLCLALALVLLLSGVVSGLLPAVAAAFVPGILCMAAGYLVLGRMPFPSELAKRAIADGSLLLAGSLPVVLCIAEGALP